MENDAERSATVSLLAERFDDFFDHGTYPAMAFGSLLVWIWMGLTEGYPVFLDGRLDLVAILVLLGVFSATLVLIGFAPPCTRVANRPITWLIASVAAGVVGLFLLAINFHLLPAPPFVVGLVVRLSMVLLGASAAVLVMACAVGYACLRPVSAAIGFTLSVMVTFGLFFCLDSFDPLIRGVLFCLLPPLTGFALLRGREPIVARMHLEPPEKMPYARGFKSMCLAFGVFFFAIGAKCALEPTIEFALGADTSMAGILVVSLVFLWAIGLKRKPVGVFKALKNSYTAAVVVLTVCIAVAPLSLEPYIGILYNADVVVMIMELWLLTAFVAHFNEVPVGKVVALAVGISAAGMAVGWATGTALYQALGHDRSYPTIGIACAVAVFSTVGFSGKSFPYLTNRGMGAQKVAKVAAPYKAAMFCDEAAVAFGLSDREREVLKLMTAGYGADAISEKLFVSYHTARTHIRNIYRKMDIHSQRDLLDAYEEAKERYEENA